MDLPTTACKKRLLFPRNRGDHFKNLLLLLSLIITGCHDYNGQTYYILTNVRLDSMGYREAIPHCVGCYNSYYTNIIVALGKFRCVSVLINTSVLFISLNSLQQDYCHHFYNDIILLINLNNISLI